MQGGGQGDQRKQDMIGTNSHNSWRRTNSKCGRHITKECWARDSVLLLYGGDILEPIIQGYVQTVAWASSLCNGRCR